MKANYLASPPLVVAYALAGRMDIDLANEPLGQDEDGEDVYLRDLWPSREEIQETIAAVGRRRDVRAHVRRRLHRRRALARAARRPRASSSRGRPGSTYVRLPPYFEGMSREPGAVEDIVGARCLVMLGDSVTTDHISPAGAIKPDSPAGQVPRRARRRAQGLQLVRLAPRQPRGDGARHVRERAPAQPARPRLRGDVDGAPARRARR